MTILDLVRRDRHKSDEQQGEIVFNYSWYQDRHRIRDCDGLDRPGCSRCDSIEYRRSWLQSVDHYSGHRATGSWNHLIRQGTGQTLKNEDADAIRSLPGVAALSEELQRRFQIISGVGMNTNSTVIGATDEYLGVRNVMLSSGAFLSGGHIRSGARRNLRPSAASDLFGTDDPLGKTVRINKIQFRVIGILAAKGGSGFFNPDDTIIVPLSTMQKILAGVDYLSTIAVTVTDKNGMTEVKDAATALLVQRHRVSDPDFSIILAG